MPKKIKQTTATMGPGRLINQLADKWKRTHPSSTMPIEMVRWLIRRFLSQSVLRKQVLPPGLDYSNGIPEHPPIDGEIDPESAVSFATVFCLHPDEFLNIGAWARSRARSITQTATYRAGEELDKASFIAISTDSDISLKDILARVPGATIRNVEDARKIRIKEAKAAKSAAELKARKNTRKK